jgi:hypothetical protein
VEVAKEEPVVPHVVEVLVEFPYLRGWRKPPADRRSNRPPRTGTCSSWSQALVPREGRLGRTVRGDAADMTPNVYCGQSV